MELLFYRQMINEKKEGYVLYSGEDAQPYVDDKILMVADGLGGRAGMRHRSFDYGMMDESKIVELLFEGIYEQYDDEKLVDYVKKSFFELYQLSGHYASDSTTYKKSGYFASRLVSAIFLHNMIYNKDYDVDSLFDLYATYEGNDFEKRLGDNTKRIIKDGLGKIAKKVNLIYESNFSNLALLGTTLCATIFREKADCVEAFCFMAGDSRPYVWTKDGGLMQLIDDHEKADGSMSNYITLTEGTDFEIECKYFRFDKPCILINATDGCFDSYKFNMSQMAFEKIIMDSIESSADTEEAGEKLKKFFEENGKHDDSSTMALKTMGYSSIDELKKDIRIRKQFIMDEYEKVLPDLLERDYQAELDAIKDTDNNSYAGIIKEFGDIPKVKEYCEGKISLKEYEPYNVEVDEIEEKIRNLEQEEYRKKMIVRRIVSDNFEKFLNFTSGNLSMFERKERKRIQDIDNRLAENTDEYKKELNSCKMQFDITVKALENIFKKIYEMGVPIDMDDYSSFGIETFEACEDRMNEMFTFVRGICEKKQTNLKKIKENREEYVKRNRRLSEKNPEKLEEACEKVISEYIRDEQVEMIEKDEEELRETLERIKQIKRTKENLNIYIRKGMVDKYVARYWEENSIVIIKEYIKDKPDYISKDLLTRAGDMIAGMESGVDSLHKKCDLQNELLEKYDIGYLKYIGGK